MFQSTGMFIFSTVCFLLSYTNSCINPLALCFLSKTYRRYFARYLCCRRKKLSHVRATRMNMYQMNPGSPMSTYINKRSRDGSLRGSSVETKTCTVWFHNVWCGVTSRFASFYRKKERKLGGSSVWRFKHARFEFTLSDEEWRHDLGGFYRKQSKKTCTDWIHLDLIWSDVTICQLSNLNKDRKLGRSSVWRLKHARFGFTVWCAVIRHCFWQVLFAKKVNLTRQDGRHHVSFWRSGED